MRKIETKEELLFNVVVIGTIVALSFFLDYKMFPNYNPNGLRKDMNGDYIFSR
ncbi:MAG: hypothetical protein JNL75_00665 [Chitinophagales bacterium]|nr:hypothetical protein [Chitinophagales bacterium]